jgi:hypothetical protein
VSEKKNRLRELLRHALDGKGAEFAVLIADLPGIRECCEIQWNADTDSSARRTAIR